LDTGNLAAQLQDLVSDDADSFDNDSGELVQSDLTPLVAQVMPTAANSAARDGGAGADLDAPKVSEFDDKSFSPSGISPPAGTVYASRSAQYWGNFVQNTSYLMEWVCCLVTEPLFIALSIALAFVLLMRPLRSPRH
jgi:hypothetical protein